MKTEQQHAKTTVKKDNLGRWRISSGGEIDKHNFFATKKEAQEFVRTQAKWFTK